MFSNFEATRREIFISIIGAMLLISIGFFVASSIQNRVTELNEPYFRALKIDNREDLFDHALTTNVGYVLAYGQLTTPKPLKHKDLDGKYLSIETIEEHYVQKTRVVTYTENGKTKTRTETYWEWDEVGRETETASKFRFLDKDFSTKLLRLHSYKHNKTVKDNTFSNVRFKYYTIPAEFNTSLFFKTTNKSLSETVYYPNKDIQQVVALKEKQAETYVVVFWVSWILCIILGAFIFIAMDNRFINSWGKPRQQRRFRRP